MDKRVLWTYGDSRSRWIHDPKATDDKHGPGVATMIGPQLAVMQSAVIQDLKEWGRFDGTIFTGKHGKNLVVPNIYAPAKESNIYILENDENQNPNLGNG